MTSKPNEWEHKLLLNNFIGCRAPNGTRPCEIPGLKNKVLLRQMGAGLVDTKRVLINNAKIKLGGETSEKSI